MEHNADHPSQPTLWDDTPATAARKKARTPERTSPHKNRQTAEAGDLWTIDEVASYLGVPKQTVYCWRTSGYGPVGFRVGKHLRWRASTVIAWTLELERQR
jgi:excisionase family DNA binding protein